MKIFSSILRSMTNNRILSSTKIISLWLTFTIIFFLMFYVIKELSFNSFFKNKDQIFRIATHIPQENYTHTSTSSLAGPLVSESIPEIRAYTRLRSISHFDIYHDQNLLSSDKFIHEVDQGFNEIFSIEVVNGDFSELSQPNTIAVTKSFVTKHFNDKNPIGEFLLLEGKEKKTVKIVVVINDFPSNSTIQPEYLVDLSNKLLDKSLGEKNESTKSKWNDHFCSTYLLLNPGFDFYELEDKITEVIRSNTAIENEFYLQSLRDIYIHRTYYPDYNISLKKRTTITYFILVSLLIFVVGLINHIIISITNIHKKLKVIGIKKVLGADNLAIRLEYLIDSIFYSITAIPFALITIYLIKSFISKVFGIDLFITSNQIPVILLTGLSIFFLISISSGILISIIIVNKSPIKFLSEGHFNIYNRIFRIQYLSLIQLVIFIILTNFILIIKNQIKYRDEIGTGISGENLYVVTSKDLNIQGNYPIIKNHLISQQGVKLVSSNPLGFPTVEGAISAMKNFQDPTREVVVHYFLVDYDFLETLGIRIVEGRYFRNDIPGADLNSIIVNEKAVAQLGIEDPLSSFINDKRIIGVVENFNLYPLDRDIPPLIILLNTNVHSSIYIKLNEGYNNSVINETIRKEFPERTFEIKSYSDYTMKFYNKEIDFVQAISFIAFITLLICIVGLVGISWFTSDALKYQIAVRKVFGASIYDIFTHYVNKFIIIVIIANIIAAPFSFFIIQSWLSKYAYQTPITVTLFLISFVLSFLIVIGAVSLNTLNAAKGKPVNLLRYE